MTDKKELKEEELDNVSGGGYYSLGIEIDGVEREYLIVYSTLCCDAYKKGDMSDDYFRYVYGFEPDRNCYSCKYIYCEHDSPDPRFVRYCKIRWKGHMTAIGEGTVVDD